MGMFTDKKLHDIVKELEGLTWRSCEKCGAPDDSFEWYYAEDRLYLIRQRKMKGIYFVYAKSPEDAFNTLKARYLTQNREKNL